MDAATSWKRRAPATTHTTPTTYTLDPHDPHDRAATCRDARLPAATVGVVGVSHAPRYLTGSR